MPNIKIVLCETYHDDDIGNQTIIREGISDWTDVTDEELILLRRYKHLIRSKGTVSIIVQDEEPVEGRIADVRNYIELMTKKREALDREREISTKARKALRKARERETYEKLKEKFDK